MAWERHLPPLPYTQIYISRTNLLVYVTAAAAQVRRSLWCQRRRLSSVDVLVRRFPQRSTRKFSSCDFNHRDTPEDRPVSSYSSYPPTYFRLFIRGRNWNPVMLLCFFFVLFFFYESLV